MSKEKEQNDNPEKAKCATCVHSLITRGYFHSTEQNQREVTCHWGGSVKYPIPSIVNECNRYEQEKTGS